MENLDLRPQFQKTPFQTSPLQQLARATTPYKMLSARALYTHFLILTYDPNFKNCPCKTMLISELQDLRPHVTRFGPMLCKSTFGVYRHDLKYRRNFSRFGRFNHVWQENEEPSPRGWFTTYVIELQKRSDFFHRTMIMSFG